MKYALIFDIHANLSALLATLDRIDRDGNADEVYHLGDRVGYAPWPNEVVAEIVGRGIRGVAGNYDSTVATDYKHCCCRYEDPRQEELSHLSYAWTREHVTAETKRYLGGLPFRIDIRPRGGHLAGPTITLVHGNQALNTVYITEDRSDEFLTKMAGSAGATSGDVVAFGHTHKPWHRVVEGVRFVKTGSVGRPKDGDWRAGYVLLTADEPGISVDFRRVEYDLERATQAILESTLPREFAWYLRSGGKSLVSA